VRIRSALHRARTFRDRLLPLGNLEDLSMGLADREQPPDPAIVERVAVAYDAAKRDQRRAPPELQPAGEWEHALRTGRREYFDALESHDVARVGQLLANFFRNSGVEGLTVYADYQELVDGLAQEQHWFVSRLLRDVAAWRRQRETTACAVGALGIASIGNPWGYMLDGHLIAPAAPRHHYSAQKTAALLKEHRHPRGTVVELGGGYAGYAYFLLHGEDCHYLGFDLPEIALVASYFLLSAHPDKTFLLYGEGDWTNALRDYDAVLLPNFEFPRLPDGCADLIHNAHSLSEMAVQTIDTYMETISRACGGFFFHENSDRAVHKSSGHLEQRASAFPHLTSFEPVTERTSPWEGATGRYREYLYRRR
jgi:putative sugar O-methyltransferase